MGIIVAVGIVSIIDGWNRVIVEFLGRGERGLLANFMSMKVRLDTD
jgi:hypothetical protein